MRQAELGDRDGALKTLRASVELARKTDKIGPWLSVVTWVSNTLQWPAAKEFFGREMRELTAALKKELDSDPSNKLVLSQLHGLAFSAANFGNTKLAAQLYTDYERYVESGGDQNKKVNMHNVLSSRLFLAVKGILALPPGKDKAPTALDTCLMHPAKACILVHGLDLTKSINDAFTAQPLAVFLGAYFYKIGEKERGSEAFALAREIMARQVVRRPIIVSIHKAALLQGMAHQAALAGELDIARDFLIQAFVLWREVSSKPGYFGSRIYRRQIINSGLSHIQTVLADHKDKNLASAWLAELADHLISKRRYEVPDVRINLKFAGLAIDAGDQQSARDVLLKTGQRLIALRYRRHRGDLLPIIMFQIAHGFHDDALGLLRQAEKLGKIYDPQMVKSWRDVLAYAALLKLDLSVPSFVSGRKWTLPVLFSN